MYSIGFLVTFGSFFFFFACLKPSRSLHLTEDSSEHTGPFYIINESNYIQHRMYIEGQMRSYCGGVYPLHRLLFLSRDIIKIQRSTPEQLIAARSRSSQTPSAPEPRHVHLRQVIFLRRPRLSDTAQDQSSAHLSLFPAHYCS